MFRSLFVCDLLVLDLHVALVNLIKFRARLRRFQCVRFVQLPAPRFVAHACQRLHPMVFASKGGTYDMVHLTFVSK